MNELAMTFDKMDIDTNEVVKGMNTKWNALGFCTGLVGGHCIGVALIILHIRQKNLVITARLFSMIKLLMTVWANSLLMLLSSR